MSRPVVQFPWGPLERAISLRLDLPHHAVGCPCERLGIEKDGCRPGLICWTDTQASTLLGVTRRTMQRWRSGVPVWAADQAAVALGRLPDELWDDWPALSLETADRAVTYQEKHAAEFNRRNQRYRNRRKEQAA